MSDQDPQPSSAVRVVIDLLNRILPGLVLGLLVWGITLQTTVGLHEQRLQSAETRTAALEVELRARTDRLAAAIDRQGEQLAQLAAAIAGLQAQVAALQRLIERPYGPQQRR